MEYPRLVYISPGPNACQGGTYDSVAVKDATEHAAALKAGFSDSIPEALKAANVIKANKLKLISKGVSHDA